MTFNTPQSVEQVVWQMLLYEYDRAQDRSRINKLFNGAPPLSAREAEENMVATNVNDLSSTKIDHDARRQFDNAFVVPDPLFTVNLDFGPVHRRGQWANRITKEANKILIDSPEYLDLRQGVFAQVVLHGIGPAFWQDRYNPIPTELGIEDVLVPGRTLRSLKNLPFFSIYRRYTAIELIKLTRGPKVDPAWNIPLVNAAIRWVDKETKGLMGTAWPDTWYPEKIEERIKESSGIYAGDSVPTIDTYDFYFWDDSKKKSGWRRRIILDYWGTPGVGAVGADTRPSYDKAKYRDLVTDDVKKEIGVDNFLYDSGDRVFSPDLRQIIHFQFGDASSVAPFRYHSVRSLGFLLYAVCHLQNRLKCRFTDAVFESLMQYFRVANANDFERVGKVDLIDKGILPEGANFVRPEERWKIDANLVSEAMQLNRQTMSDVSSSFTQDFDMANEQTGDRETATRTMAKVNSTAALVGSMLNRAYAYEKFRYTEICRRLCIPNNPNPDAKRFRVNCLKAGIPEEALDVNRWEIQCNRVVGGGNDMMQVAIADKLMAVRNLHGPEAQHEILKFYDAVITKDYAKANMLNPEQPHVTDSIHDTEIVFGTLMQGNPVRPRPGLNTSEVIETTLHLMEFRIANVQKQGGIGTPQEVQGLQMAAAYASAFIQQLAQDENEKAKVKEYNDMLKNLMNLVKAMAQRQQQMAEKIAQQNGGGGMAAEDQQKLQFESEKNALKLDTQTKSAAQRLAQRQIQFESEQQRKDREHAAELQRQEQQHALETHQGMREHAAELHQGFKEHQAELAKTEDEAAAEARMRENETAVE